MIETVAALGEVAKIAGGALAGGFVTWWLTRHNQNNRRRLSMSIGQTLPMGLPGFVFDIKIMFEGEEQEQIQFHICELTNLGTEHLSEVELILWPKDQQEGKWLLKGFNPGGPHLPQIDIQSSQDEYVRVKLGALAPKETAQFTLVSSRSLELDVKCMTENIRFTDQRDISEKRSTILRKLLIPARSMLP
ncbi:hypothetical protein IT881_11460 [Erythrobacter sp. A30-3]|nr:hypothetical protein IT881_11460 [Erythrobacter sp. A30-3]